MGRGLFRHGQHGNVPHQPDRFFAHGAWQKLRLVAGYFPANAARGAAPVRLRDGRILDGCRLARRIPPRPVRYAERLNDAAYRRAARRAKTTISYIGENTEIDEPGAVLNGPLILGENCLIKTGARTLEPETVIGDNAIIEDPTPPWKRRFCGIPCTSEKARNWNACTICHHSTLKDNVQIQEGAVVGDRCHIEDGAVVRTMIKLWPDKVIEADSQVTSSLDLGFQTPRIALSGTWACRASRTSK